MTGIERDEALWGEDAEAVRVAVEALTGHHPERGGLEREQAAFAVVQAVKPVLHAQWANPDDTVYE